MVTDNQVRNLMKLLQEEKTFKLAAAKAGMDEKTARKYRKLGILPSESKIERYWKTRKDPFKNVWNEIEQKLVINPGLEAKTLFEDLQRNNPGLFQDGQLRTLQRRIKIWRGTKGPEKEVFFSQIHKPGNLCQSDFTHMSKLDITINRKLFKHMIFHFVLTYSNWEACTICYSESFESLSQGLQNALWELGGIPNRHQTDRLSTAVNKADNPEEFTKHYSGLLKHYGLKGQKIQAGKANENGDIEQRHYRFKKAVDQALMLRGSRDFDSLDKYNDFLKKITLQLNSGRQKRFLEEQKYLKRLPQRRLEACRRYKVRVSSGSTIRINHNVYSVNSRLIGEHVKVYLYIDKLEVWYGQKVVEILPRIKGAGNYSIKYQHIISWLIKKPGAFNNYKYRRDLFPTVRFKMAYDALRQNHVLNVANREYLSILFLAARENETLVDDALRYLIDENIEINKKSVERIIQSGQKIKSVNDIEILEVNLASYDDLLKNKEITI